MPKENTCSWQLDPSLLKSEIFIQLTEARREDTQEIPNLNDEFRQTDATSPNPSTIQVPTNPR
jgi:hypothetical protein